MPTYWMKSLYLMTRLEVNIVKKARCIKGGKYLEEGTRENDGVLE